MRKRKNLKRIAVFLLAVVVFLPFSTSGIRLSAYAADNSLTGDDGSGDEIRPWDYDYDTQVRELEKRKKQKTEVVITHDGLYVAKSSKFYGRKITGVNPDGSFILGSWECLDSHTNECVGKDRITVTGDYAQFAYSLDISWGTDFPYSGIFWYDYDVPVKTINILHRGFVRNVSVNIRVNGEAVFYDPDCSSHEEWKP